MTRRQRSRRRLIAAGLVLVLLVSAAAVFVFFRTKATGQSLTEARAEGMTHYENGDYEDALRPLSYYLSNRNDDVEALVAFAETRSKVATDDFRHITEPIGLYSAALALDPDNIAALEGIILLYERTGRRLEWMETAARLLTIQPDHIEALRLRATGHAIESNFQDAEQYVERLIELEPDKVAWRMFYLGILQNRNASLPEVLARCEEWIENYEGDGRYHMLKANVLATTGQSQPAQEAARVAAQLGASELEVLQQLVSLLDLLQLYSESESLIEATIAQYPDELWPYEALVRRQWQRGQLNDALTAIETVESNLDRISIPLLRWKCLLHVLRHELDEAEAALQQLAAEADADETLRDSTRGWIQAVRARIDMENDEWAATLKAYRSALALDPRNSIIYFLIGEAYSRVGEHELAANSLEQAVRADTNWVAAQTMYIDALLQTNQFHKAAQIAAGLLQRSEQPSLRLHTQFVRAVLGTRLPDEELGLVQRATGSAITMTAYVQALQEQFPTNAEVNELLIATYLREGRSDRAAVHLRRLISSDDLEDSALLSLARLSGQHQLGLEQQLVDSVRERQGLTLEVADLQARLLHQRGRTEDGIALLHEAREKALRDGDPDQTTQRRIREQADLAMVDFIAWSEHPRAVAALRDYLQETKSVERASYVLRQRMTWEDEALAHSAIQILEQVVGESSPRAAIARARHASQFRSDDEASLAQAMRQLNAVLQQTPESVEAQTLMAALYLSGRSPQPDAAIRHLERAIAAQPSRAELYPQLISLLQRQGDFTTADRYLTQMGRYAGSNENLLRAQIAMYESQGDYESIVARLSGSPGGLGAEVDQLVLFIALQRTGRMNEAENVLQGLLSRPQPSDAVFRAAADFYSNTGRPELGVQLIKDRLLDVQPGVGAFLLGRLFQNHGSLEEAENWMRRAVEQLPDDPAAWNQLATHYLARGQYDDARTVIELGLEAVGENEGLQTTLAVVNLNLGGAARQQALQALNQFGDDCDAVVRMLLLFDRLNSRPAGTPPGVRELTELRDLVRDHPNFYHGWQLAITTHAEAGEYDLAHQLARQAIGRFPNNPGPAELGTRVLLGMGDLERAQDMARIWRQRSLDRPLEADIMLAAISVDRGQAAVAAERLNQHAQHIINQRERMPQNLTILFQTLLHAGEFNQAASYVAPLLREDQPRWLEVWIGATQTLPPAQAASALNALEGVLPDQPAHRLAVAREWGRLGSRARSAVYFDRSIALADALIEPGGAAELSARMLIAELAEQREDSEQAIIQYRAVLQRDADHWEALARLASLLIENDATTDEALAHSQRAVELQLNEFIVLKSHIEVLGALNQANRAVALLEPRAQVYFSQRNEAPQHLMLWIRALIMDGQWDRAQNLLAQLPAEGEQWSGRFLELSRAVPDPYAGQLVEMASAMLSATPQGRLAVGAEWSSLGERLGKREYLVKADEIAQMLADSYPVVRHTALLLRATVRERMLDDETAEQLYREIVEEQPTNWIALNNLAAVLLRQEKSTEEALSLSERALREQPEMAEVLDTRARALLMAGRLDEAGRNVQTALRAYPTKPWFLLTAAEIALADGEADRARDLFAAAERAAGKTITTDRLLAAHLAKVRGKVYLLN